MIILDINWNDFTINLFEVLKILVIQTIVCHKNISYSLALGQTKSPVDLNFQNLPQIYFKSNYGFRLTFVSRHHEKCFFCSTSSFASSTTNFPINSLLKLLSRRCTLNWTNDLGRSNSLIPLKTYFTSKIGLHVFLYTLVSRRCFFVGETKEIVA